MRKVAPAVLILLAGCLSGASDDPGVVQPDPDPDLMAHLQTLATFPEVVFHLDEGDIRMLFYTGWMPVTTTHVGGLVEDYFYDGTTIHRVVDDFVIQGGDKTGTGEGGSGPGGSSNTIPLEIKDGLQFGSGAVGLARWTDDTGDSQWFITEKPALHLNDPQGTTGDVFGAYALFAQVFEGMEVVRQLAAVDTIPQADRPVENIILRIAEMLPPPTDADLINLIPQVIEPFDLWYARGATLEAPQFAVVGHPIKLRIHAPPPEDALGNTLPCDGAVADGNLWNGTAVTFAPTADPCTFEASLVADAPGAWTFSGHDAPRDGVPADLSFQVIPWHEAYRPFTGAP